MTSSAALHISHSSPRTQKETTCDQFSSASSLSSLKQEAADETKSTCQDINDLPCRDINKNVLNQLWMFTIVTSLGLHQPTLQSSNSQTHIQKNSSDSRPERKKPTCRDSNQFSDRLDISDVLMLSDSGCPNMWHVQDCKRSTKISKLRSKPKKEQAVRTKTRINHVSTYNFQP